MGPSVAKCPASGNIPGLMQTVGKVKMFSAGSENAEAATTLPDGQVVKCVWQDKEWAKVEQFNGGKTGYIKLTNLQRCPEGETGVGMPKKNNSLIDPKSDTVAPLFIDGGKVSADDGKYYWSKIKPAGFADAGFGQATPDKTILLPNGLYAAINRNYDESSIFFVDMSEKKIIKAIGNTPPNWDLALCNDKLYITHGSIVTVINYRKMEGISVIPLETSTEGLLCCENKLYVTLPKENSVAIIDTGSDKVLKMLKVGPAPMSLSKCRKNKICVSNAGEYYVD